MPPHHAETAAGRRSIPPHCGWSTAPPAYAGLVNEMASSQPENALIAADPRSATEMLELDRAECLRLLAEGTLGRVAIDAPHRPEPVIRPVNYVFDEASQSVLIRSGSGSKLFALLCAVRAAF